MTQKSKSLLNKPLFLLVCLIFGVSNVWGAAPSPKAKSCQYRTFNIKTSSEASSGELLMELAEMCGFSIVLKDPEAEKVLAKNLNGINIKDLSLEEIFNIVIVDNDLFYTFDKNFLKISALTTKSFKVDYITSVRTGSAVLNASVDSTPRESKGSDSSSAKSSGTSGTSGTATTNQNMITSNDTFDFWKTIETELISVLNTGAEGYEAKKPIINSNAGMITITATKKQLDRASDYINLLKERLHRQVLIDVSIISVLLKSSNKTGVNWSKFQLGYDSTAMFNNSNNKSGLYQSTAYTNAAIAAPLTNTLTVVNDAVFSLNGLIDFLGTNGETKVVSSPKVLTMNNQQALITIGDNINYRVPEETSSTESGNSLSVTYTNYSIFIGVLLNITPEISEDNEIILRINPSVSDFKYTDDDVRTTSPREIAPDTSEKKLSTVVKVKDGSTIILGGLIASNKGKENSSVPLLSSIPLLGEAFKHTADTISTTELVFVITPHIMGTKGTDKATLKDLGFSQKIYE